MHQAIVGTGPKIIWLRVVESLLAPSEKKKGEKKIKIITRVESGEKKRKKSGELATSANPGKPLGRKRRGYCQRQIRKALCVHSRMQCARIQAPCFS